MKNVAFVFLLDRTVLLWSTLFQLSSCNLNTSKGGANLLLTDVHTSSIDRNRSAVRPVVPERSTATARSSHRGHRLSNKRHRGSRPGRRRRKRDPPESSSASAAGFPVQQHFISFYFILFPLI